MRLQVKIDQSGIKRLIHKTKKEQMQVLLHQHANDEINAARQRILVSKLDPTGTPWAAWRPSTERWRRSMPSTYRLGLLLLSQRMVNSFFYYVKAKSLHIINNTPYAAYLQYGTDNMVARRFVDLNPTRLKQRILGHLRS